MSQTSQYRSPTRPVRNAPDRRLFAALSARASVRHQAQIVLICLPKTRIVIDYRRRQLGGYARARVMVLITGSCPCRLTGLGTAWAGDLNRSVRWSLAGGRLGRCDQAPLRQAFLGLAVLGCLEGVEVGVLAAEFHQLGVPALLDDPAVPQDVDPVRVPDAGHPVRD